MNIYCAEHKQELEIEKDLGSEIHVHCSCNDALRARLAEAERLLEIFASAANDYTNNDENFGAGGLWWTDYALNARGEVWTGGHLNRRQLHMSDLKACANFLATR